MPALLAGELRLADVSTFLTVHRTESVTAAARELGVTASQVSKTIGRLERALGRSLFTRGARGVSLTSAGQRVLPQFKRAVDALQSLDRGESLPEGELTLAAPSSLLPAILPDLAKIFPRVRLRAIELPPALLRRYAADGLFDIALVAGGTAGLPPSWSSVRVGELRKSLFTSPEVAKRLGARPTVAQVRTIPFVGPLAYDGGALVSSPDDCPLGSAERVVAVEVATMDLALRVAAECGYLTFGPAIAAKRAIRDGALVEVNVASWHVSEELFLACDETRVLARVQKAVAEAVRVLLAEPPRAGPPRAGRKAPRR